MHLHLFQSRIPNLQSRFPTGFTLIELLVVLVIIGVLWATLTLAIGSAGGERQLEREAEQLRALIGYACEQAELSGREIGISLNGGGYRFSHLEREMWQGFGSGELRARTWAAGTTTRLARDGNGVTIESQFPDKPQLLCFSSGELTPFQLELGIGDVAVHYRVDGSPDGSVNLVAVQDHAR
jgi:general secretion pathway protein H